MPKTLEKLLGTIGFVRKEKASIPSVHSDGGGDPFAIWRGSTKPVSADRAFAVYSGWVSACIRAISEEIAGMRFELYRVLRDGTWERVDTHEVLDLLDAVNPTTTGTELRFLTGAHLEAIGNAYWYLDGMTSENSKPTAIYPMNASRVKVLVNRNSFPSQVSGYEYQLQTKKIHFEPWQILHFKYPDPSDMYEGLGTVQTAAQWIDADNYAMEFNRRFFLNGARPSAILETETGYTPEQLTFIKSSFKEAYAGVDNAHKPIALPKGVTFKEAGQGQKDMDFSHMADMMRDRILAAFRVPRTALGITEDVNRANAEATNYVFALRTIKPKMDMICSYLNEFLIPRYGDDLVLTYEDPVPENRQERIAEMQSAMAGQPVMSVNEARDSYFGLDPIENGESVMQDFSKIPLGKPTAKQIRRPMVRTMRKNRATRNAEVRKEAVVSLAQVATDALKSAVVKGTKDAQGVADMTDDQYEVVHKQFLSRVAPYESLYTSKIKEMHRAQYKDVVENLENATKSKAVKKGDLVDKDKWVGVTFDLELPIAMEIAGKEGMAAAALIGQQGVDVLTPEMRKVIEKAVRLMAKTYTDTTLELLKTKLEEGIKEGKGLTELKETVRQVYEYSDEVRATRVARTEVFRVANLGAKEAWKQSGVVKTIKWYTSGDERVCEFCGSMHGKVIDVEADFFKKGDTLVGSKGTLLPMDYADVEAPPIHPNCNCYTRPETISTD
jgi:HK97 family phage portal protein